jgi:polysulfide reductase chain B
MAKKYGMIHDENLCIGCQACNVACRSENDIPQSVYRLQVWVEGPKEMRDGSFTFGYHRQSCVHCESTPCVTVCPTGASFIDENGISLVNTDICVGCLYCNAACPYDARYVNPQTNAPDKCTFCKESRLGRGEEPACVAVCPTSALVFGDINDPRSEISKTLSNRPTYRQKTHLGTGPKMFIVPNKKGGIQS